ncbi:hypothetical protein PO883_10980 [Massilia sp. DJPM01]|uniref:hypothetical protein n=1 Tax=Massilia sp. DJPM01 TaxID=3024404 RepID=UPI00259E040D|nr:hypothetical protein [Massilia sp. DJPM01]MDM5177715.1 hypothetical protein [Massilia sp. DJPM01]
MRYVLFIACLMLAGCGTAPLDLRLEKVELIKLSDVPDAWRSVRDESGAARSDIALVKLTVSTTLDIVKSAKKHALHFSHQAFLCKPGEALGTEVFAIPYLRADNMSLETAVYFEKFANLEHLRESNGRIAYTALIPLDGDVLRWRQKSVIPDRNTRRVFDPQTARTDLCWRITGGAMWTGSYVESNIVTVPTESMLQLLEEQKR